MSPTDLRKIGSISLLDLDIINTIYGRDFLPFPFMYTQPSRFSSQDECSDYERSVPERFNTGDLAIFRDCIGAYAIADIRVECHVQHIPADATSIRVVAIRLEQMGFLAKQRPDDDVIDIYELSPYLLGPAVADSAALQKPGHRSGIIIPEYAQVPNNTRAPDGPTIQHTIEGTPNSAEVPRAEVTAFGTVQTHWRPTRRWGIDRGKKCDVWVRIKDDGEYLYKPDFSEATPVTKPILAERIDRSISEDIKALRRFRSE
jgi:hypothetical protein